MLIFKFRLFCISEISQHFSNISNNSNFYFRNDGQLLQGTTGVGLNTGLGNLSIYQEGTVNNFQYNYWCSPIGVPANVVGNANFGISRLNRPTTLTASTPATLIGGYDGVSSPLSISTRWIYTFTTSTTYAQWNAIAGASTIAPGLGFTMKGTTGTDALVADATEGVQNNTGSAQRYDFRGLPNDGTIVKAAVAAKLLPTKSRRDKVFSFLVLLVFGPGFFLPPIFLGFLGRCTTRCTSLLRG